MATERAKGSRPRFRRSFSDPPPTRRIAIHGMPSVLSMPYE